MRLMRFGDRHGKKIPCILGAQGAAHDVSGIVTDFSPETLSVELIETLRGTDLRSLPIVDPSGRRIAPPVAQPRNIWCIGLNYSDHAKEAGLAVPEEPILFNKASATYCGANDPIPWSDQMSKLDWEVELGVVMAAGALGITRKTALDRIAGFVVVNDVSERTWQLERGGQWVKGKSFPNFCPTGPVLVTADEIADPQALDMWLDVNATRMQTGNTGRMIFDVATIVSYMSTFCRLEPGDLICTGTPPGVGMGMKPARYLTPGDTVTLGIQGLGEQRQVVTDIKEIEV